MAVLARPADGGNSFLLCVLDAVQLFFDVLAAGRIAPRDQEDSNDTQTRVSGNWNNPTIALPSSESLIGSSHI